MYLAGVIHASVPAVLRERLGTSAVFVARSATSGAIDVLTDSYERITERGKLDIADGIELHMYMFGERGIDEDGPRRVRVRDVRTRALFCRDPRTVYAQLWNEPGAKGGKKVQTSSMYVACDGGELYVKTPGGVLRCSPHHAAPDAILERLRKKDDGGESVRCVDALVRWTGDAAEHLDVDEAAAAALRGDWAWAFSDAAETEEEGAGRGAGEAKEAKAAACKAAGKRPRRAAAPPPEEAKAPEPAKKRGSLRSIAEAAAKLVRRK